MNILYLLETEYLKKRESDITFIKNATLTHTAICFWNRIEKEKSSSPNRGRPKMDR